MSQAVQKTRFALTDITLARVGLFRPHRKVRHHDKEEMNSRLHATKVSMRWDEKLYIYTSPYLLDASDWLLFATLCAMAGLDKNAFDEGTDVPEAKELWGAFNTSGWAERNKALWFETTIGDVRRELGRSKGGTGSTATIEALQRLAAVTMRIETAEGEEIGAGALLAYRTDKAKKRFIIGLSPLASRHLLDGNQYLRLSLMEARALRHDGGVLLHSYLTARFNPGQGATIPIDDLVYQIYQTKTNTANRMYRRKVVREGLRRMATRAGWTIPNIEDDAIRIERPSLAKTKRLEEA